MRNIVETNVIGLYITSKCTLNCELCASGIPYYKDAHQMDKEKVLKTFERLFHLYDKVGHADLLGGEPLMHPDIDEITESLLDYKSFIPEFRIITNGTIVPSDRLCEAIRRVMDSGTAFLVLLDNYGECSVNIDKAKEKIDYYKIPVRVDKYFGKIDEQYSGGWVKYGDYLPNNKSESEILKQWSNCICRNLNYHEVWEGKIYPCAYSYAISALGKNVMNNNEVVDLFDSTTDEERRNILKTFNLQPNGACNYCYSLSKTAKRYPAAIQLPKR